MGTDPVTRPFRRGNRRGCRCRPRSAHGVRDLSHLEVWDSSGAVPPSRRLSHVDGRGRARMVDVSPKATTTREAVARGELTMRPETLRLVAEGKTSLEELQRVFRPAK